MWWVKSRRAAGMSWKRFTGEMTWRYSYRVVRRRATPRSQPSISARENVHTVVVAHTAASSFRQGSRAARRGPYATTATATATEAAVPGPACGPQCPYNGAALTNSVPSRCSMT